ncbi:hypothetical protein PF008_g7961 [Phytophthora fragariae]|uniref:Uncharacterized protein n=1 Tax=Phytophthora fragariae TaxID=53985 RepID=A0A6G0S214_9STRA|nr:hypothetical protein PF008_g7961 [Phytophthora fragariae]
MNGDPGGGGDSSGSDEEEDQDDDGDEDSDAAVDFKGTEMGSDLDTSQYPPRITTAQNCTLAPSMSEQHGSPSGLVGTVATSRGCLPIALAANFEHTFSDPEAGEGDNQGY